MTTPCRIQLRRAKGWRMPENTVKVDRTTHWGNPFIVGKHGTASDCVDLYKYLMAGLVCLSLPNCREQEEARNHVAEHRTELAGHTWRAGADCAKGIRTGCRSARSAPIASRVTPTSCFR